MGVGRSLSCSRSIRSRAQPSHRSRSATHPVQAVSINNCHTLTLRNLVVDNTLGHERGGHNTDGFDIGASSHIDMHRITAHNQDDCIAINSGDTISFRNGNCSGGHGLSIGSIGGRKENAASNISISNTSVSNSTNALRIKTIASASGLVSNISYSNIHLSSIKQYAIVVQQDYKNGGPTGNPTIGVKIHGVSFDNIRGDVDQGANPFYVLCGQGSCADWSWRNVDIAGGEKSTKCQNVPNGLHC